jgi:hypothetical protein
MYFPKELAATAEEGRHMKKSAMEAAQLNISCLRRESVSEHLAQGPLLGLSMQEEKGFGWPEVPKPVWSQVQALEDMEVDVHGV